MHCRTSLNLWIQVDIIEMVTISKCPAQIMDKRMKSISEHFALNVNYILEIVQFLLFQSRYLYLKPAIYLWFWTQDLANRKYYSRSLHTLWPQTLCGWNISQTGSKEEKVCSGQRFFCYDIDLETYFKVTVQPLKVTDTLSTIDEEGAYKRL